MSGQVEIQQRAELGEIQINLTKKTADVQTKIREVYLAASLDITSESLHRCCSLPVS